MSAPMDGTASLKGLNPFTGNDRWSKSKEQCAIPIKAQLRNVAGIKVKKSGGEVFFKTPGFTGITLQNLIISILV